MAHELTPEDRALCSLPLYHINGEVVTAVTPLVSGGSVVMPHKFSTLRLLGADFRVRLHLVQRGADHHFLPVRAARTRGKGVTDLDQLRFGRSASSALPPSLHRAFEEKFRHFHRRDHGADRNGGPGLFQPHGSRQTEVRLSGPGGGQRGENH